MSSNGPLYFSTCPEDSDWTPKAFDQSWTGVSAVWEDLRPSTDLAGPEGGNVYFRRVNSYKRTEENFRDIRQAQALFNTEDAISQLYVVTYHKMANSNSKLNCDAGATWQYVFTFPLNAQNPLIAVNYGQLDWSVESSVMGVNGHATAENFISNFNTVFDRPMNGLASTSINCKNGNECAVVNCQKTLVFSQSENMLVCRENEEFTEVRQRINLEFSTSVSCDYPDLSSVCGNFLTQAFEFINEIGDIVCQVDNCTSGTVNFIAQVDVKLASESSEQSATNAASSFLDGYAVKRVSVGFKSIEMMTT